MGESVDKFKTSWSVIAQVIGLNPSVSWEAVDFIYTPAENFGPASRYVELSFKGLPMVIDAEGQIHITS
jgi:hypothetical protein